MILRRYILRQVAVAILFAIGIALFILLTGNALKEILQLVVSGKMPWSFFLKLLGQLIPSMLVYALPLGFLSGLILVLSKLASQREILAMRSLGLSYCALLWPIFVLGFFAVIFSFYINLYQGPLALANYRHTLANALQLYPERFLPAGTISYDFPGYIVYVGEKEGADLNHFWIWECADDHTSFIQADKASVFFNVQKNALELSLSDGEVLKWDKKVKPQIEERENSTPVFFKQMTLSLSLEKFYKKPAQRYDYMPLGKLLSLRKDPKLTKASKAKIDVLLHQKISFSLAPFILLLIGIPLSIQFRRAESMLCLGLALMLALLYYFLSMALTWLENYPNVYPVVWLWVPNLLYTCLGITLWRRMQ